MNTSDADSAYANCFLYVDCNAIGCNLETLRKKTKSKIMAVVKNNGYGLSLIEYARLLTGFGIGNLAAGSFEEAMALKKSGIGATVLLLTPQASAAAARELLLQGVVLTVGSVTQAEAVQHAAFETGLQPKIHIKIDTGLGRYGFVPDELQYVSAAVKGMDVQGVYTHFSSPYTNEKTTRRQFGIFLKSVEQLKYNGVATGTLHCCASGALLNFPDMHMDMVRAGSAILGRVPDARSFGLKPAVFLKAPIMAIKPAASGSKIGYRSAVSLKRSARIGILSVGCACGLQPSRRTAGIFKQKQYAVINSQRAELIGPLGIGAMAVNLTGVECNEGDLARLDVNPLFCAANIQRVYDRNSSRFASDYPGKPLPARTGPSVFTAGRSAAVSSGDVTDSVRP